MMNTKKFTISRLEKLVRSAISNTTKLLTRIASLNLLLESPEFKDLENEINRVVGICQQLCDAVAALRREGPDGFARKALGSEQDEIDRRKRKLAALMEANSTYMQAVHEAKAKLEQAKPGLEKIIAEADAIIQNAAEDKSIRQLEAQVETAKAEAENARRQREMLVDGMRMIRDKVKEGADEARKLVKEIKDVSFKVKRVHIMADARELIEGNPMNFTVEGDYKGQPVIIQEKWAPLQSPTDLYRDVVKKILGL